MIVYSYKNDLSDHFEPIFILAQDLLRPPCQPHHIEHNRAFSVSNRNPRQLTHLLSLI